MSRILLVFSFLLAGILLGSPVFADDAAETVPIGGKFGDWRHAVNIEKGKLLFYTRDYLRNSLLILLYRSPCEKAEIMIADVGGRLRSVLAENGTVKGYLAKTDKVGKRISGRGIDLVFRRAASKTCDLLVADISHKDIEGAFDGREYISPHILVGEGRLRNADTLLGIFSLAGSVNVNVASKRICEKYLAAPDRPDSPSSADAVEERMRNYISIIEEILG